MEKDVKSYLLSKLIDHFEKGEGNQLVKILMEDLPEISSYSKERLYRIIERLIGGEPIQYITGVASFYGYFFKVDRHVLIPRPETEELVYAIEKFVKKKDLSESSILDIGTGSGCIPITLNLLFPKAKVMGADISKKALEIAIQNNQDLNTNVRFFQNDVLDEEGWNALDPSDIIVSNPPYIPFRESSLMAGNVLDHEPHLALFVEDEDPLIFYNKIYQLSLRNEGTKAVFLECNEFNAREVCSLFAQSYDSQILLDLQGKERIVQAVNLNT